MINKMHPLMLLTLAAVLVAGVWAVSGCAAPQEPAEEAPAEEAPAAEPEAEPELVELLFVQHSDSVTLADGVLTLEGIAGDVLYFSDRPHRVVGRETLEEFLDAWDEGKESFEQTPPNAVLTVKQEDELRNLTVVLKNPVFADRNLAYQVEVLDGPDSGNGGLAALFIDVRGFEPGRGRGREFDRPSRGRSGRGGDHRRFRESIKRDLSR
jgi:hypothetical protein